MVSGIQALIILFLPIDVCPCNTCIDIISFVLPTADLPFPLMKVSALHETIGVS